MCIVTPIAIKIKMILPKRIWTTKMAEYPIAIHKKEMDKNFILNGVPFPSR